MPTLNPEQRAIVKKFGHMIVSTGGNDVIELVEREGVNYFNNPLVAELQGSCYSQIQLLMKLQDAGLLSDTSAEPPPAQRPCVTTATRHGLLKELQSISMMASTAMHQDKRDQRNILEVVAERLCRLHTLLATTQEQPAENQREQVKASEHECLR
jgi:hypothetical protein